MPYRAVALGSFRMDGESFKYTDEACPALSGSFMPMGGKPMAMGTCAGIEVKHLETVFTGASYEYYSIEKTQENVPGLKCMYDQPRRAKASSPCRVKRCPLIDGKHVFAVVPEDPVIPKKYNNQDD